MWSAMAAVTPTSSLASAGYSLRHKDRVAMHPSYQQSRTTGVALLYHKDVDYAHDGHSTGTRRALLAGLAITLAVVVAEAVTGILAGSIALFSDAGHAFADSAGLILAAGAVTLGQRAPDVRRTYGYARFEVLALPVHALLLTAIAVYVVVESIMRLRSPADVDVAPVLVVAILGLAANLVIMRLLHTHSHDNINARAARIEAMADALGSVAVVISTVIIALGGWHGVDAAAGLAIALFILPRAWTLFRQAGEILLEGAPAGIDPAEIVAAGSAVEGVIAMHDVHVWSIAPSFPALSAHVELQDVACTEHILTDLAAMYRRRFGIGHVTLQPETPALHEAIRCCMSPDSSLLADTDAHRHQIAGRPR
jgi:cobalt-zinc-cadmium efflux system protein